MAVRPPKWLTNYDAREIEGTPILVMEYVEGLNLAELERRLGPLPIAHACELIRQAAVGLQYAHEHGLVHRDVKPSNLMLSSDGTVKILDLGLALLHTDPRTADEVTTAGQAMGTADFMAPEQCSDSHTVDIRCDIYSLGCTLYKLLTGKTPFSGPQYRSNFEKMTAHVREPIPPARQLRPDVPEAMAAVLDRMLAKAPADRFATPAEVAEALKSLPLGETAEGKIVAAGDLAALLREAQKPAQPPVKSDERLATTAPACSSAVAPTETAEVEEQPLLGAGAASVRQAVQPSAQPTRRRWRLLVVAAGLLLAIGIGIAFQVIVRIRDRERRETAIKVPEGSQVIVEQDGREVFRTPQEARAEPSQPGAEATKADGASGKSAGELGWPRLKIGPAVPRPKVEPIHIEPQPFQRAPGAPLSTHAFVAEPTPIEGVRAWTIDTRDVRGPVGGYHLGGVCYSPDGKLVAAGSEDGTVRIWDATTGNLVRILVGHPYMVHALTWSPDARYVAVASGFADVPCWEVASGKMLRGIGRGAGYAYPYALAWSTDGRLLALGDQQGSVWLLDVHQGGATCVLRGPQFLVRAFAWSPDAQLLAVGRSNGTVNLWDVQSRQVRHTFSTRGEIMSVSWSPDGAIVAACEQVHPESGEGVGGKVYLLDGHNGTELCSLPARTGGYVCAEWLLEGRILATADGWGDQIRFWDMETGAMLATRGVHSVRGGSCRNITVSAHADGLAVASDTGALELRSICRDRADRASRPAARLLSRQTPPIYLYESLLSFPSDGKVVAVLRHPGTTIDVWDSDRGLPVARSELGVPFAVSPDGGMIAAQSDSGVILADIRSNKRVSTLRGTQGAAGIAWSDDGKTLAVASSNEQDAVRLFDTTSGKLLRTLPVKGRAFFAWAPNGTTLAVGTTREVHLCNPVTGELVRTLSTPKEGLGVLAWSPDGKALAAGRTTGTYPMDAYVWEIASGTLVQTIPNQVQAIRSLRWLDNGDTLAVVIEAFARTYDVRSGKLLREVGGRFCAMVPDGRLVDYRNPNAIGLRELDTGALIGSIVLLPEDQYVVISADGHYRGSPGVEKDLVYVVETDQGQSILTPAEFAQKYHWKNDPEKVRLRAPSQAKPDAPKATPQKEPLTPSGR